MRLIKARFSILNSDITGGRMRNTLRLFVGTFVFCSQLFSCFPYQLYHCTLQLRYRCTCPISRSDLMIQRSRPVQKRRLRAKSHPRHCRPKQATYLFGADKGWIFFRQVLSAGGSDVVRSCVYDER